VDEDPDPDTSDEIDWEYNPDAKDFPNHIDCSQDAGIPEDYMDWEYADLDPDPDASDGMDWEYNPDAKNIPDHIACSQYADIL
jgi:hypothetical protein